MCLRSSRFELYALINFSFAHNPSFIKMIKISTISNGKCHEITEIKLDNVTHMYMKVSSLIRVSR